MKVERRWPNSPHLETLVKFYQSKMYDNIILADNILDGLTLNPNEASYILKVIRGTTTVYKYKRNDTMLTAHPYRSTYYLAKMKKRSVKNYIVVKRKQIIK